MSMFADRSSAYLIAEIGSNWSANIDAALALIDAAADAGADCAKFQVGHADHVYDLTQYPTEHAAFKKWVEPTLEWVEALAAKCKERGIDFAASAFCFDALDAIDLYVKWHKVASIEATWPAFVQAVLNKGKPTVISTGLMDMDDYIRLVTWTVRWHIPSDRWVPMECTVSYPCAPDDVNLDWLPQTTNGAWGFSDHTTDPVALPREAVRRGATVIEKHLRPLYNSIKHGAPDKLPPDWNHSLHPREFEDMVRAIRLTEMEGLRQKRIRESEKPYLQYRRGPKGLRGA